MHTCLLEYSGHYLALAVTENMTQVCVGRLHVSYPGTVYRAEKN